MPKLAGRRYFGICADADLTKIILDETEAMVTAHPGYTPQYSGAIRGLILKGAAASAKAKKARRQEVEED